MLSQHHDIPKSNSFQHQLLSPKFHLLNHLSQIWQDSEYNSTWEKIPLRSVDLWNWKQVICFQNIMVDWALGRHDHSRKEYWKEKRSHLSQVSSKLSMANPIRFLGLKIIICGSMFPLFSPLYWQPYSLGPWWQNMSKKSTYLEYSFTKSHFSLKKIVHYIKVINKHIHI